MDAQRLQASFALVSENGEGLIAYFYADLFQREPALRDMFPASMEAQNRKLLATLSHIVSKVGDPPALVPFLRELGRRHHGYGIVNDYYPRFGVSLLTSLAHFTGPAWNDDLERDWATAYSFVAQIMAEAAAEAALESTSGTALETAG